MINLLDPRHVSVSDDIYDILKLLKTKKIIKYNTLMKINFKYIKYVKKDKIFLTLFLFHKNCSFLFLSFSLVCKWPEIK